MNREYFSVELSTGIDLALSLTDMKVATQFEVTNICIVPGIADFWYGVTNFKGSLMWVLDSDRFLMHPLMGQRHKPHMTPAVRVEQAETSSAFPLTKTARQPQKVTSVILARQQAQKVAIVTRQLKGIISVEPDRLKPIENDTSMLSKCCSAVVQTEALSTYIIDPAALLFELQKRSLYAEAAFVERG